ncbi:MAG: type II secretion system protein [Phycisphaerales bacterium]
MCVDMMNGRSMTRGPRAMARRAFTMVEILIVVVILGILAALVVPQFANATEEAGRTATIDSLTKIRRAIDVYYIRNGNLWPNIIEDNGQAAWGELMTNTSNTYLREVPHNYWVPSSAARVVIFGTAPDVAYQTTHGWIFDPTTGRVWAGGFDGLDQAYPKP